MTDKVQQRPNWETPLLKFTVALTFVIGAAAVGAAYWAEQQAVLQHADAAALAASQQQNANRHVRLNLPHNTQTEPSLPLQAGPATRIAPSAESQPMAPPSPTEVETAAAPDQPIPAPVPQQPAPPPAAPHLIHLVVTDPSGSIDGLVKLPKGLTLVTSATNANMPNYIGFATHIGHKVLLAFPASKSADRTGLLMTPENSDDANLAILDRILTDNELIAGVKLYWHNPFADKPDFMEKALALIAQKGLPIIGSNGPLEAQENEWARAANVEVIRISSLSDAISDIALPAYGDRQKPQYHSIGVMVDDTPSNSADAVSAFAAKAGRNGWTLSPLPLPSPSAPTAR